MKVEIAFISVTWMQLLSVLQNSVRPLSLSLFIQKYPYFPLFQCCGSRNFVNSLVTKSQIQCTLFKYNFVVERETCGGRTFYLMMCGELSPSGPLPLQLPGRHFWEVLFWTIFFMEGLAIYLLSYSLSVLSQWHALHRAQIILTVSLMHLEVGVEDYL